MHYTSQMRPESTLVGEGQQRHGSYVLSPGEDMEVTVRQRVSRTIYEVGGGRVRSSSQGMLGL